MKTTPVKIYVGGEYVGYGKLAYDDRSAFGLYPRVEKHCDESSIYIEDNVISLKFCWNDIVTSWLGGSVRRTLNIPVYIGDTEVGSATVEIEDSSGSSTFSPLILTSINTMFTHMMKHVISIIEKSI